MEIDGKSPVTYSANLTFESGKSVEVVAVPALGYVFNGWSGSLTGITNPTEISMTCPKKITANFARNTSGVSIIVKGSGSATLIVGDAGAGKATLVATPDNGWRFDGWTGVIANKSPTVTLTINMGKNITANFVKVFPIWLLTLMIVALALIGLGGYYALRRGYIVITTNPAINRRHIKASSKKRHKTMRW